MRTLEVLSPGADAAVPTAKVGWYRSRICALLLLATTINYIDRQVLGVLAPHLQAEIGWNEIEYGYVVTAFQAAYAIGLVSAGAIIDRLGTRIGYALAIAVWGIAGNFPAAIKTVAEWFPRRERAFATGIFNSGSNIGAIVAPLVVPLIAVTFDWRAAFLFTGVLSAAWLVTWLLTYRTPEKHPSLPGKSLPTFAVILKHRRCAFPGSNCFATVRPGPSQQRSS